jgi:glutaminase
MDARLPASVGPVDLYLRALHTRVGDNRGGAIATYIPELAKADPEAFGIAIATVDGKVYSIGDADLPFTIQSISKAFIYGYALDEYGREAVLRHVGVEPTGEAFNAIVLDEVNNRPFNPMVNAGAMAAAELVRGDTPEARIAEMLAVLSRFAGRSLHIDEAVFRSEQATGNRNRAIAYMMLNAGMIHSPPETILDIYFRQCSVRVTCTDLAVMAATLANNGVNPLTGERALASEYIHDVLTVMNSCGMYNYAGQWSYEVGMPAKSGVGGGILAVIPGQIGIGVFSPRLDAHGHSVRGVAVCKEISETFGLHIFRNHINSGTIIRRDLSGAVVRSKRMRTPEERQFLDTAGKRIRLIELQGALFFGSTERVLRHVDRTAAEDVVQERPLSHVVPPADPDDLPFGQLAKRGGGLIEAEAGGGGRVHDVYVVGNRVEARLPGPTNAFVVGSPEAEVDFKVFIHKLHRGKDLPSVQAGGTYAIGRADFSDVGFPQPINNCRKCHNGEKAFSWAKD